MSLITDIFIAGTNPLPMTAGGIWRASSGQRVLMLLWVLLLRRWEEQPRMEETGKVCMTASNGALHLTNIRCC